MGVADVAVVLDDAYECVGGDQYDDFDSDDDHSVCGDHGDQVFELDQISDSAVGGWDGVYAGAINGRVYEVQYYEHGGGDAWGDGDDQDDAAERLSE
jgi:hypothetical protein